MRVFVTGGTGFIGSAVVARFAQTAHRLVCLTRREAARGALESAGAQVVIGDVADRETVLEAMFGCDALVHMAAAFEFWCPDRDEYARANVEGTRNVLACAIASNVRKVVHVSTAAAWGDAPWPIREETPLGAHCASAYARSKRDADAIAWQLYEHQGLPLVVVYPAAVLGPHDAKAIGRYIERVATGAMPAQVMTDHVLSFVHVRDVAEAIVRALEKPGNIGAKYLLSGGSMTFGELNRVVAEASGTPLPRMHLPDWLTLAGAGTLTAGAALVRRPPALDLALDQMLLMRQGFQVDGSRAERELGLQYTPLAEALAEEVAEPAHADA